MCGGATEVTAKDRRTIGTFFEGDLQIGFSDLISNFGVWISGWYTLTLGGLVACYVNAIPFYGYTLVGDLAFTGILFGSFELSKIASKAQVRSDLQMGVHFFGKWTCYRRCIIDVHGHCFRWLSRARARPRPWAQTGTSRSNVHAYR